MTSGPTYPLDSNVIDDVLEVYDYKREDIIILLDDDTSPHPPPTRENIVGYHVDVGPRQPS